MGNAPSKESGRENARTKDRVRELNQPPAPIVDRQPSHKSISPKAPEATGTDVVWTSSGGAYRERQGAQEHLRMHLRNSRDDAPYREPAPEEDGFGELSQMRNRLSGVSRHPSVYSDMQSNRSTSVRTRGTGSRMSMPPQNSPVDLEATISILQELRKTASPEQLVALHRALLPTKEEASTSETRSITPGSDSGAALVRRRSLAVPGLATRDTYNVLRKKEEPSPPMPASADGWWGFEDFGPASPSLIVPAFDSPREEKKSQFQANASGDEFDDYSHLGNKIGKLTITNGAPSPVPSTMSRCVEKEKSMRDLLETEKAALDQESTDASKIRIARIPPLVLENSGTTERSKDGKYKKPRPTSPRRGESYVKGDDSHAMGQPSPSHSMAEEYVAELAAGGNPFHCKTPSPNVSQAGFIDEGFHEARSPTKSRAAAARITDVRGFDQTASEDMDRSGPNQGKLRRPVHLHHPDSGYSSGVSLNAVDLANRDSQYAGATASSSPIRLNAQQLDGADKNAGGPLSPRQEVTSPTNVSESRAPTENGDVKKRRWMTDRVKNRRRLSLKNLPFTGSGMNCTDSSRPGSRASYLEPAKPVPAKSEVVERTLSSKPSRRKLQKRRLSRLAQFSTEDPPTVPEVVNEPSFSVMLPPQTNADPQKSAEMTVSHSTPDSNNQDSVLILSPRPSTKNLRSVAGRDNDSPDSQRSSRKGKEPVYQQGGEDEQHITRSAAPSRPSSSGTTATKTARSKGKASAAREARALSIKVLRDQAAAALDAESPSELAILRGRGSTVPDLTSPSTSPSRYDGSQGRSRPNSYYGNDQLRANARRADTPNFSRPHSVVSSCDSPPPLPEKRVSGLSLNTDVGNFALRRKSKSSLREQEEKIVVEYPEEKICVDSEYPEDLMPKRDSSDSKVSSQSKVSSDEGKTDSPIAGWESSKVHRHQRAKSAGDGMRPVSLRRKSVGEGLRPRVPMDRSAMEERRKSTGEGILKQLEERAGDSLSRSNGMRRKSVSEGLLNQQNPEVRRKAVGGDVTTPAGAPPMPTRRAPREPPSNGNSKSNRRKRASTTLTPVFASTNNSTTALSETGYSEPPTPLSANSSDLNLPAYFVPSPRASQLSLPAYFVPSSSSSSAGSGPGPAVAGGSTATSRPSNHQHRRSYAGPSSRTQGSSSRPHSLALQLNSGGSASTPALPLLNHSSSSSLMRDMPPIPIPPRSPQRPGPRVIDRYSGGFRFNYEHGVGVGGSAGTRGPETRARKKSMTWTSMFGVDLEDVPVLVS
ncbi:uncharacterized protein J3D65DRAFT_213431 [Phyllosticta citribraziliensis]|uniref:Proteophosphoglycan ppg4 n=1 Tax=Phyllosticta citribraziliensis TaxID=989973 RepID=A0ABR1M446_9PEZI